VYVTPFFSDAPCSPSSFKALFLSKEGAPQVRLKIVVEDSDIPYFFTFLSPRDQAAKECEDFKTELTAVIARNRDGSTAPITLGTTIPATGFARPSVPGGTPRLSVQHSPLPAISRATSVSSDHTPGPDVLSDFRIRKKVLVKDPELAALHRDLVVSGQITESEFWEGREVRHSLLLVGRALTRYFSICWWHKRRATHRRRGDRGLFLIYDLK
jgi:transcription initiation factor TFIIH subunit 1